jgi:hypothetical protein
MLISDQELMKEAEHGIAAKVGVCCTSLLLVVVYTLHARDTQEPYKTLHNL